VFNLKLAEREFFRATEECCLAKLGSTTDVGCVHGADMEIGEKVRETHTERKTDDMRGRFVSCMQQYIYYYSSAEINRDDRPEI